MKKFISTIISAAVLSGCLTPLADNHYRGPRYETMTESGQAYFDDKGNIEGLHANSDNIVASKPGRIVIDDAEARVGKDSIRFVLHPGDCSKTWNHGWDDCEQKNERIELQMTSRERAKEEFYTVSLKLDENFKYQKPLRHKTTAIINLYQFYTLGVQGCFNLVYRYWADDGLWIDERCADQKNYRHHRWTELTDETNTLNRWHDFLWHIKWSTKDDGFIVLKLNGEEVFTYNGITVIESEESSNEHDVRNNLFIYRYGKEFHENTTPLTMWADGIGRYDSIEKVPALYKK